METLTDNSPDWAWSCGEDRARGILTQIRITSTASPSKLSRRSQYMHTDCPALDVSSLGCRFAEVVGKPDCMSFDWFYEAVMKKTKKQNKNLLLSESHPDRSCLQCLQLVLPPHHRKRKQGTLFSCPSEFCLLQDGFEQRPRFGTAVQFLVVKKKKKGSVRCCYSDVMHIISSFRSSSHLTAAHGSSSL